MDIPHSTIPGLVWAYRYDPEVEQMLRMQHDCTLETLRDAQGFVWLHLAISDARVPTLLEALELPEKALAALNSRDLHTALSVDPDLVCGTLVDFQREFDEDTKEIGWLHFAITDRLIVTTRLQPLRSVDRARASIEKARKITSPLDILEILVIEFQRTAVTLVTEMNDELNIIEDAVYDNTMLDERRRLAPVRRTVVRLHRHLRNVLALLKRANTLDDDEMPEAFPDMARRLTDRLESAERDVYSLQDRARLLHEDIDSKISSETNRHLYILSLMTAFLLPPTLVTGFFGMNTSNLPFAGGAHGTLMAGMLIILSILFAWLLVKRTGIL
jgi:zinc transporter